MINGAHTIIYSRDAEADRAFFRDVLEWGHVDVGHGWLIFALPPSELAVHPGETGNTHELYLMCEDIEAFRKEMMGRDISCTDVERQPWGLLVHITLPGGSRLGVYQPLHERPVG
jgi:predicted enzyme related to lactoylglutathione lyase